MKLLPNHFPVTCHTKHVGPDSTFVAIPGHRHDGMIFVDQAIALGATKIVHAKNVSIQPKAGVAYEAVDNPRQTLALYAAQALNNPAKKLKLIGITGTKGKTTTAYLIHHLLQASGKPAALLSTIANKIGHYEEPSSLTTPSSDYLHMFFKACVDQNIEYVVMEVSSHALSMDRVYGLDFEVVGWTNLAPEHLDFHASMEDYFDAKSKIFNHIKPTSTVIINSDDPVWGNKALASALKSAIDLTYVPQLITFGAKQHAQLDETISQAFISKITSTALSMSCRIHLPHQPRATTFHLPKLFGTHNAYNLTMALLACQSVGLDPCVMQHALASFQGVPGRQQVHALKNGALAIIDYAHNPSSMLAILRSLRRKTKHLIVVFGCGGDRDKTKRPVMGHYASTWADVTIITSDNPRSEDPQAIIQEIYAGISQHNTKQQVIIISDRKSAIVYALQQATPHSIVAILGKGHEQTQQDHSGTRHFSDFEVIREQF